MWLGYGNRLLTNNLSNNRPFLFSTTGWFYLLRWFWSNGDRGRHHLPYDRFGGQKGLDKGYLAFLGRLARMKESFSILAVSGG